MPKTIKKHVKTEIVLGFMGFYYLIISKYSAFGKDTGSLVFNSF